jgi:hypothetical protein
MRNIFVSGLSLIAVIASANATTYSVETITGKNVQVSAEALQTAYFSMIATSYNKIFKNEDGSFSIVNPRVMVDGRAYVPGFFTGQGDESEFNSANGLCRLNGFTKWISMTIATEKTGPIVDLNSDGTLWAPSDSSNQIGFGSLICR